MQERNCREDKFEFFRLLYKTSTVEKMCNDYSTEAFVISMEMSLTIPVRNHVVQSQSRVCAPQTSCTVATWGIQAKVQYDWRFIRSPNDQVIYLFIGGHCLVELEHKLLQEPHPKENTVYAGCRREEIRKTTLTQFECGKILGTGVRACLARISENW